MGNMAQSEHSPGIRKALGSVSSTSEESRVACLVPPCLPLDVSRKLALNLLCSQDGLEWILLPPPPKCLPTVVSLSLTSMKELLLKQWKLACSCRREIPVTLELRQEEVKARMVYRGNSGQAHSVHYTRACSHVRARTHTHMFMFHL